MRRRRRPPALLLAAGAALAAAVVYLMARALVRPPRMTDSKALHVLGRLTPADVELLWQATRFTVTDLPTGRRLTLAAWWMPAARASARTVVLVHGYADAKVGALAWAPAWHGLGFNILAVDLRAHGDSDGTLCTGGYAERHDLVQVVNELVARRQAETGTLLLFGASMGAAAVAGAACDPSAAATVHGVVLDSPFADFRSAAAAHWDRLGLPAGRIARLALWAAEAMTGARFGDARPADLVRRAGCPVLVLAAGEDPYVSPAEAAELEAAVRDRPQGVGPSLYRRFEGVGHLMAVVADREAYRAALHRFVASVPVSSRYTSEVR